MSRLLQLSSKGSAFESYTPAIMSNGFGGEVIELSDMSDLAHLMDAMGISGAHQVVIKASITSWKKNPDAAFQLLAAAKVRAKQSAYNTHARTHVCVQCTHHSYAANVTLLWFRPQFPPPPPPPPLQRYVRSSPNLNLLLLLRHTPCGDAPLCSPKQLRPLPPPPHRRTPRLQPK